MLSAVNAETNCEEAVRKRAGNHQRIGRLTAPPKQTRIFMQLMELLQGKWANVSACPLASSCN